MDWPRVMAPLAKEHPVYAIDLPGWGFSEPHATPSSSMENEVSVISSFIRQLGLSNVTLVGISYGGAVTWACGAMHVPEVSRLWLLNPMPPYPLKYLRSPLYRAIFFLNRFRSLSYILNRRLLKSQYKQVCRESLKHMRLIDSFYLDLGYLVTRQPKVCRNVHLFAKGAQSIPWETWEERLKTVQIPVTIIHGKDDRVFHRDAAEYVHRLIPNSKLDFFEDCGHAIVFDQHRKLAHAILEAEKQAYEDSERKLRIQSET